MGVFTIQKWLMIFALFVIIVFPLSLMFPYPAFADYTGTITTDEGAQYSVSLSTVPTPTPTATPEPTPSAYDVELITHLGNIEAFLIFFTVVLLCFFVYKFLRIFF